ncbi:UNVERIFIED_CONTAM: hypothetical protein Sradi_5925800 [Sesamum radiatum]|uniref:Histone H4 n=1 Tax=Sesamum radiatum TaxID=300843 RepID=A0AAW2KV24_SESRA
MSGRGKGGKGLGKGGAKRHRKVLRITFRYHEAGYSSFGSQGWCQAYQWSNLRGNPWCTEDFP